MASEFANYDHSENSNHRKIRMLNMTHLMTELGELEKARTKIKNHENALKIAFIYRNADQLIWDDRESGADKHGSFWTVDPTHIVATSPDGKLYKDFKLLGDRACPSHAKCGPLMLVKDISYAPQGFEVLKPPSSAYPVWRDNGSGAAADVTIWKLNPPPKQIAGNYLYGGRYYYLPETNWKCLGDVATRGHESYPDLNKYRCVIEHAIDYDRTYEYIYGEPKLYAYITRLVDHLNLDK